MILLVSGTRREVLEPANRKYLGLLTSPATGTGAAFLDEAAAVYLAGDNDAFTNFNEAAYRRFIARIRRDPARWLFVTAPDYVGDARATTMAWDWYWPLLIGGGEGIEDPLPAAYVAQDGAEDLDLDDILGTCSCLFIGGSTEWKLSAAAADLIRTAKEDYGRWVHMGRVNTLRRFRIAYDAGCDSIDGTAFSMFPKAKIPCALRWLEMLHRNPPAGYRGQAIQRDLFVPELAY